LGTSPKTRDHFHNKLEQALIRARQLLKPQGRLLIMFGHKKPEAWDAFLQAIIDAGFWPTMSLPIHTERKDKFRHGHIDALASSCLIVCKPAKITAPKETINWTRFENKLKAVLKSAMSRLEAANFLGTDLVAAVIAPACGLLVSYDVIVQGKPLTIGQLIEHLPRLVADCELDMLLKQPIPKGYAGMHKLVQRMALNYRTTGSNHGSKSWLDFAKTNHLAQTAVMHTTLLYEGKTRQADEVWSQLSSAQRDALCLLLRAAALLSPDPSPERQLANASLSRITHQMRAEQ
ncbi:MAG: hypothetical protein MN733_42370, partial [Nitrososphaera sp.]|nr:hypothetical protein [Nitrososphaera sp.]